MTEQMGIKHLVLIDGECGLCNRLARFIATHDDQGQFVFARLQSRRGIELLGEQGIDPDKSYTLFVKEDYTAADGELLSRSGAVLFIAHELGWPWKLALIVRVFPWSWLDAAYDYIARNRYRVWGDVDSCPRPDTDIRERFIDD